MPQVLQCLSRSPQQHGTQGLLSVALFTERDMYHPALNIRIQAISRLREGGNVHPPHTLGSWYIATGVDGLTALLFSDADLENCGR